MKEKDIDRLFRDTFYEAEETPDKSIWQRIEKQLDEEKNVVHLPQRRQTWISYAAAAILILGATLAIIKLDYVPENRPLAHVKPSPIFEQPTDHGTSKVVQVNQTEHTSNKPEITVASHDQRQHIRKQDHTDRVHVELLTHDLEEIKPILALPETPSLAITSDVPVYQVTEIEDIKPLIEPEEEMESMYAQTTPATPAGKNIVTSILNTISENIEVSNTKDIRFRADEEGSLRIDILNSLVKNRNKKRK